MPATAAATPAPYGAPPIKAMLVMALPAVVGLGFGAMFPLRSVTIDARDGASVGVAASAPGQVVFDATAESRILGAIPIGKKALPNLRRVGEQSEVDISRQPGSSQSTTANENTVVFTYGDGGDQRHEFGTGASVGKALDAIDEVLSGERPTPQTVRVGSFLVSVVAPTIAILFTIGIWMILVLGSMADALKARTARGDR